MGVRRGENDAILYLFKYPSAIFRLATNDEKRELVGITLEKMTLKDRKLDALPAAPFVFKPKAPSPYGMLAAELLKKPELAARSDTSLVQPELDL